jgi:hypothetical protein
LARRRDRLPPAADRALERLKWSARRPPAGLELAPRVNGPAPRLLIGPTNFAGQGRAWARAWGDRGPGTGANWAFSADPKFGYEADYSQPISVNAAPRAFQARQFERVVSQFEAVVIESGRPLFGRLFGYSALAEAEALAAAGLAVAALWHGSDIRLPSQHAAAHALSPYALPALRARAAELEATARRHRRAFGQGRWPQLVSTPDLLDQVAGAAWCPVVVAPEILAAGREARPVLTGGPPRVVHVPSNPLLKGTELIEAPLRRLAEAGRVEYIRAENLPAAEVRRLYARADVVVDQFRLGIYGVAAAEALALGRLVVSDVDQSVRRAVAAGTGLALPIEQAAAADLEARLEAIIADPAPFRELAAAGPAFARAVHSGESSAAALAAALGAGQAASAVGEDQAGRKRGAA